MNGDWILPLEVEDADLEEGPVSSSSDEKGEPVFHADLPNRIAYGVTDVVIGDAVLSRWLSIRTRQV
jgi:hypothetical protein